MEIKTTLVNDKYIINNEEQEYRDLLQEYKETKDFFKRMELDKRIKEFEQRGMEVKANEPKYYEILNLTEGASETEIKEKYSMLATNCYENSSLSSEERDQYMQKLNNEYMQISKNDESYKKGFIDGRKILLESMSKKPVDNSVDPEQVINPTEEENKENVNPIKDDDETKKDPTTDAAKEGIDPTKDNGETKKGYFGEDTIPEGHRIQVIDPKLPTIPTNPVVPEEPIEVVEQEKKPGFFKKHKKAILIAAGLAAAAAVLAGPVLIPSLMYANSALWTALPNFPALQAGLHAINTSLGGLIGATFTGSSGIWTAASGVAINSSMAAGTVLGHAINLAALPFIGVKVNKWLEKRKAKKIEKQKEKEKKEKEEQDKGKEKNPKDTPPIDNPNPTPVINNYYETMGIPESNRKDLTIEQLNAYFIKKHGEIRSAKAENMEQQIHDLRKAFSVLKNPDLKKMYDEMLEQQKQMEESAPRHKM